MVTGIFYSVEMRRVEDVAVAIIFPCLCPLLSVSLDKSSLVLPDVSSKEFLSAGMLCLNCVFWEGFIPIRQNMAPLKPVIVFQSHDQMLVIGEIGHTCKGIKWTKRMVLMDLGGHV